MKSRYPSKEEVSHTHTEIIFKQPEVEVCLVCLENSKEANVDGAESKREMKNRRGKF